MNTSLDLSFDTTNLLDDHLLNTNDFLPQDDFLPSSPSKHGRSAQPSTQPPTQTKQELGASFPDLRYSVPSGNALFQVTHHLRENCHEQLHNDKIAKLLKSLGEENDDFEMDDKLRTRVFKGRFNGGRRLDTLDAFDMHLDSYLHGSTALNRSPSKQTNTVTNENKENICPVLEPSKRKLSDSVDRRTPLKRSKSHSNMPALKKPKMMASCTGRSLSMSPSASPKRVCVPRDIQTPGKPSLKHRHNLSIFLVDSSTGSVNDATQFGTELNSSNCEGFPLPDDINEIVQIPTNDTSSPSAAQKMAIIKAVHGARQPTAETTSRTGFYSKNEFEAFKLRKQPREEIATVPERRVKWAEDLEW